MYLPSLTALKSFEAAARHVNFARAARQLGVQPPAVSRQVADLEASLGVQLFVRSKPRLTLTRHGQELFAAVTTGFNEIRQAVQRIQSESQTNRLKVETSIGFASCWLLSRLPEFHKQYPDIDLQLQTRDSTWGYEPDDADIAIMFGEPPLPGADVSVIFDETMLTVCAAGLLKKNQQLTAAQLLESSLLYYEEGPHTDDWKMLLSAHGLDTPEARSDRRFNSYIVYLQAILNGDGIGLGWEHLLDDHLNSGRLKIASPLKLHTDRGYFCCIQERSVDHHNAHVFADWICSQVASDIQISVNRP